MMYNLYLVLLSPSVFLYIRLPDVSFAVDWALKRNDLSVDLSLFEY